MHTRTVLVLVFAIVAGSVGVAAAGSGWDVAISETTDVPDRTVEIEGEEFRITEVVQRDHGESLTVDATAPDAESTYRLRLYNANMTVVQSRSMQGDDSATFDLGCTDCDPGSYILFLYNTTGTSEERVLAQPVVVAGYDVTLDMPASAEEGETVTATVDVADGASTHQPDAVEVALGNGDGVERRYEATHESGTTYTAEVPGDLEPGTYLVYGGALSSETLGDSDEPEALGISASQQFEVTTDTADADDEDDTESETTSPGGSTNGGGTGDPAGTSPDTPTSTPPTTDTETPSSTVTATPTDADVVTASPPPTDTDDGGSPTPSVTEDDVITPVETTATDGDGAGIGLPAVVGVLSGVTLWLRRRTRNT